MSLVFSRKTQLFILSLAVIVLCAVASSSIAQENVQVKRNVQLKAYEADASVDCPDNYSYTAAKGCVPSTGRISQFSIDGRSPVIGVALCMPDIRPNASPVVNITSDSMLNNSQVITLEDGSVIIASSSANGIYFSRYDVNLRSYVTRQVIVDMDDRIGLAEHNNLRNDNLRPTNYFKIAPLDGARWVIVFMARSAKSNKNYIMGAVVNSDQLEKPTATTLSGTSIFPISFEGKLLNDSNSEAADILIDAAFDVVGLKNADGTQDGRFVVAWVREDYYKPGQQYSIFGKIYNESVQQQVVAEQFGAVQTAEIRLENTTGSLRRSVVDLAALRNQGFALAYNDEYNYANMYSGSLQEGAIRLFDTNGALYRDENTDVVGGVGDLRRIDSIEELTSGVLLVVHKLSDDLVNNKRISASLVNITPPESPVKVDMNGADAGGEKTLTNVAGDIHSLSVEMLPSSRSKILFTWHEDRLADSVRSMMVSYNAGIPTFENISSWFRVDTAGVNSTPLPLLRTDARSYVVSKHLQTIETPLGNEHHFLTKYEGNAGRAVYRIYKIPDCW